MNSKTTYENSQDESLRSQLHQELDQLSTEKLNSVWQFFKFLEYQSTPIDREIPTTNTDIDRIVKSYRQQNKLLPIGLAKGEFVVPDDFKET